MRKTPNNQQGGTGTRNVNGTRSLSQRKEKIIASMRGWVHFREKEHPLEDCVSICDDDGMGLVMKTFAPFHGKQVMMTLEVIDGDRYSTAPTVVESLISAARRVVATGSCGGDACTVDASALGELTKAISELDTATGDSQ